MDIESALAERLTAIRSRFKAATGEELNDASLWFYGEHWTIYLTAHRPRVESASVSRIAFADIEREGEKLVDALAAKIMSRPTAAEIAYKMGLSEGALCEIVCAAHRPETAAA